MDDRAAFPGTFPVLCSVIVPLVIVSAAFAALILVNILRQSGPRLDKADLDR